MREYFVSIDESCSVQQICPFDHVEVVLLQFGQDFLLFPGDPSCVGHFLVGEFDLLVQRVQLLLLMLDVKAFLSQVTGQFDQVFAV